MNHWINLKNEVMRLRISQLQVNEKLLNNEIRVPVHLALGHESIAVALAAAMHPEDKLLLNHRNIQYHLALGASAEDLIDEYQGKSTGLANGKLGSMNLMNPKLGNLYTSNILANNLPVSLGVGLAAKIIGGVIWVVTGDGAIEEGAFYEALLNASTLKLPIVFIIENNEWSMSTRIEERRVEIDLGKLADSINLRFAKFEGNNPEEYLNSLIDIRSKVTTSAMPFLIEVKLSTLGGYLKNEENGRKRYINYHSGAIKGIAQKTLMIEHNDSDPVYVVSDISGGIGVK
jgi:pyruvate dehydrogenase E1 component alpha subunit